MMSRPWFLSPPWRLFAIRDASVVLISLMCWMSASQFDPLAWIAGGGLALSAYLFHEWSHLWAAHRVGVAVQPAKKWYALFLFNMSPNGIAREAFMLISLAGFVATLVYLLVFLSLPRSASTQTALTVAQGLATLTLIFEAPIALWAMVKNAVPPVNIPGFDRFN